MSDEKAIKATIGLVLYNGLDYLKYSLPSLVAQDYPNVEYLFRDQSPNGEAYDYIINELPDVAKKVKLERGENLMHSGGHNALINKMSGEYYITASYDMLYEPDFVNKMVSEMEKPEYKKFGSGAPVLLQWDFEKVKNGDIEGSKTRTIDSVGIGISKKHSFMDSRQNEHVNKLPSSYKINKDVFGSTAALAIYRKKALDDIAYTKDSGEKEYFDELMHFGNDCDLAYRLQWAGHSCLYIAGLVAAYHDRQTTHKKMQARENSKEVRWIRNGTVFSKLILMKKNYSKNYSLKTRIRTSFKEFKTYGWAKISRSDVLDQYKKVELLNTEIIKKRRNMPRRKSAKDIEKYMLEANSSIPYELYFTAKTWLYKRVNKTWIYGKYKHMLKK